jgi:hypothetical protein
MAGNHNVVPGRSEVGNHNVDLAHNVEGIHSAALDRNEDRSNRNKYIGSKILPW